MGMERDPLLIDLPEELFSSRLRLRVPRAGDGAMVFASVRDSLAELKPWMPWAKDAYSVEDGETWCRKSAAESIGVFAFRQGESRLPLSLLLLSPSYLCPSVCI